MAIRGEFKEGAMRRLSRIEDQRKGLRRMAEEDTYLARFDLDKSQSEASAVI